MEYVIIAFLAACLLVSVLLLVRLRTGKSSEERMRALLQEGLAAFQKDIRDTMDSTRREVEASKTVLSQNTIKTLETIKEIEKSLKDVMKFQEEAQKLGESLETLLQSPKLRGTYGEEILEEMLDRVLPAGIWRRQYQIEGGGVVDAVVCFKDVVIPVDAKFPRDDYEKYASCTAPEEKKKLWARFEAAVKRQVKEIEKKYIKPDKGTAEFALMFIPSETVYYETIAATNEMGNPNELYEYARAHHVVPVSPNTFYAFLQVIIMGIRHLEILKGARELQKNLAAVERDFTLFFKKFEEMGARLEKACEAYRVGRGHVERYKRRLDEALRVGISGDRDSLPPADAPPSSA